MALIQPPRLLPVLAATVGLFRHRRSGLNDPAALPRIERSLAGATLDADWLAAYRASVGLPVEPALPPLALQIAAAPLHMAILGDPRFPFRALGMVHLTQRITQTAPMPSGARFDLRAFCTDARWEKRGMSFGLVTEACIEGEPVWRGETRALAPGRTRAPASADAAVAAEEPAGPCASDQVLPVAESTGRRYAAIAGDLNPIHKYGAGIIKNPGAGRQCDGGICGHFHLAGIQRDQIAAGGRKVQFGRVGHLIHNRWRHGANIAE